MKCWRCFGLGLLRLRTEEGYTVYRQCPTCRPDPTGEYPPVEARHG